MNNAFRFSFAAALAAFSIGAWAQATNDVANDNVVNVITGAGTPAGGTSKALSLMFPSHSSAPSMNGNGCVGSGTKVDNFLFGLYNRNRPVHELIKGCGADQTIAMLGRMCQFRDARLLLDKNILDVHQIDLAKSYPQGPEAYKTWVDVTFKNYSFEECLKFSAPKAEAPAATPTAKNTKMVKLSTLTLFKTGKFELTETGKAAIMAELSDFDQKAVAISRVSGHTDNVGNVPFNQKLSEDRASAVAAFLKTQGFTVEKVQGYGKTMPVAPGNTPDARAMNRRVEIVIRQLTEEEVKAAQPALVK